MKEYLKPCLQEILLEDVLTNSELDNVGGDPAPDDNYDNESEWGGLIAD